MGLNTKEAYEILKSSEAASFMFDNRVPHLLVEDEKVYSALNIIVKDIVSLPSPVKLSLDARFER